MIIVMRPDAAEVEIEHVIERIRGAGLEPHVSRGVKQTIIGAKGDETALRSLPLEATAGVEKVVPIMKPWRLASRAFRPEGSVVRVGEVEIGAGAFAIAAGPCTVETRESLLETARAVSAAGARLLRGGAFKPRTSPYDFQGLGEEGLKLLAEAREATGLAVVTEVRDLRHVELVARYADCIQIGARNMQNFDLLKEVGAARKPVLLKRGMAATVKEWLMCAEYILAEGNPNVILCERGIRTFEDSTRFTFDVSAIPNAKHESHLPVVADPSHAAGHRHLVAAVACAAVAAGADGLLVEVHPRPEEAVCDGGQALLPADFERLARQVEAVRAALAPVGV